MGRPLGSKNKNPRKDIGRHYVDWFKMFGTDFLGIFYTYLWMREDFTPYYIGKGTGRRAFTSNAHGVHKPAVVSRILIQCWDSEEKAFEMEKWYISFFGRKDNGTGILRNLTDGGENPPSWAGKKRVHSVGTSEKISKSIKELWRNPEYAKHMSEAHKGHEFTDTHKSSLKSSAKIRRERERLQHGNIP